MRRRRSFLFTYAKYMVIYGSFTGKDGRTMADKRNTRRHRKRLTLKFGVRESDRFAFTEEISPHGMFIKTANAAPPGSTIKIDLSLGEDDVVTMEARVMWAKKVPANMVRLVRKCGMGVRIVRFVAGETRYHSLCEELHAR